MRTVAVETSQPYEVKIGTDLLRETGEQVRAVVPGRKAAVITDDIVDARYSRPVMESLEQAGFEVCRFVFPNGEKSKNLTVFGQVLEFLAEQGLTRTDAVIALGGGVVGDLAGFAASSYLRGIRFIQIPTTLLAAVDSSVGGKTAVDLKAGKNLAGAFYQPSLVLCDCMTLNTLPPEILADGMAETIKYGILYDRELFDLLAKGDWLKNREEIIARCVQWKADVVKRDERDTGERQLLNLGHTAAHAIEKLSNYTIRHGSAVAIGMAIIARAAWKMGISAENCAPEIEQILSQYHLPVSCVFHPKEMAQAALADKKRKGGTITLVLPETIGKCLLHPAPVDELERWFRSGMERN